MDPAAQPEAKRNRKRTLLLVLTNVISLAFLVWALHDINLAGLKEDVLSLEWRWVTVAVVADIGVYVFHGWRWSLLLTPVAPVSVWQCVRAIYVGLFANEVLPFRTGEVIRCYLQARWSDIPFSVTIASALVERIFDGLWLVLCMVLATHLVSMPKALVDGAMVLGVIVVFGAILLGLAMFYKHQASQAMSSNRFLRKFQIVIEDLHLIGHSRFLYFSAFASLPYLLLQVIPIYALMQAYGFDLSMTPAFILMVMLRLSSVVPQAPGNLGAFHAVAKLGLKLFGVDSPTAANFSVVLWSVITLPLLIAGFIALAITGLKMGEIHREAHGVGRTPPVAELKS